MERRAGLLTDTVEMHGGDILKFAGDAIIVCWSPTRELGIEVGLHGFMHNAVGTFRPPEQYVLVVSIPNYFLCMNVAISII